MKHRLSLSLAKFRNRHEFFPIKSNISFFPWIFGLAVGALKHGQVVPMISSSLGYRSGSIFHHQWNHYTMQKTFVYAWQAVFHMWKIGIQRFSASVHMEPNSLAFESFPMIFKRYEIVCWVTPNVSASSFCVWHESSFNNAFNSASSYTFGLPLYFVFDIKFTVLKLLKSLTTTSFT